MGWEILFNPDEEIGSPSSSALFGNVAKRHHLGLIYELSFADGNLAEARKGSGNFVVVAKGKTAHAGRDGINMELYGGFGRAPKVLSPANETLCKLVQSCGESFGLALVFLPTGGCCDGNNLTTAGLPNIDTLSVQGSKIHSSDEYMVLSSLTTRSQLSALILLRLAQSDDLAWLARENIEPVPC